MFAEPAMLPERPLAPSAADTLNEFDPVALPGETSENVVDALAPEASDATDAGLKDDDQPPGTVAANVNGDAAQPTPFLFVTVIVYCSVPPAAPVFAEGASATAGAAVTQAAAVKVTRTNAPSAFDDSVVNVTPSVESVTAWPMSSVESHVLLCGSRSIW